MYTEISSTLQNEIASFLEKSPNEIGLDDSLLEMGIDSLQMLQLLVMLERNFSVHMDESDLEHFTSVHTVATLAVRRLSETPESTPIAGSLATASY
jgi:acyl carrier protein